MASLDDIERALRAADASGNTDDARQLAQAYAQMKGATPAPQPQQRPNGLLDAVRARTPVPRTGYRAQVNAAFDKPAEPVQAKSFGELGSNYGDIARNVPVGVVGSAAGLPGNIEALGRAGLSKVTDTVSPENQWMPTSSQFEDKHFGPAQNEYQSAGRFGGELLSQPAVGLGGKLLSKVAGFTARQGAGGLSATGPTAIREGFQAAKKGGAELQAYDQNMRGQVSPSEVVAMAKDAVAGLRAYRGAAYKKQMAEAMGGTHEPVDFAPIDAALQKTANIGVNRTGTIETIPGAREVHKKISEVIGQWRNDPNLRTPHDLDEMKQAINNLQFHGELKTIAGPDTPGAVIVREARDAISKEIERQAPIYKNVMSDYSTASDELNNIEKTMSLGKKALTDTSLRKLQSIMRNNANTNYGARAEMGDRLNDKVGGTLMPALAGQAMNSWLPRGLGQAVASGEVGAAGMGAALGHPMAAAAMIPVLAASSPRLVGEAARLAGRVASPFQKSPVSAGNGANVSSAAAIRRFAQISPQVLARLLLTENANAQQ